MVIENRILNVFTKKDVKNKELIMRMLKYEDSIYLGEKGKEIYDNKYYRPRISLDPEYTINRMALINFGYDGSDESVNNYRSIFQNYYNSANDYDEEVLSCVTYMRNNKCVYYKSPCINVNDIIPNCTLYYLDGKKTTNLYDILKKDYKYGIIAAYSNS